MKKNILYLFAFLAMPVLVAAQECDCAANFNWVKKTFEENDAGYQYIIDQKGLDAYAALNEKTATKAKNNNTLSGCQALIYEWSKFFRSGHFGFTIIKNGYYDQNTAIDPKILTAQPVVKVDFPKFEKKVSSIKSPTLEGIWNDGTYKVGIIQTKEGYQGFIIDASKTNWKPGQLKFKITADSQNADLWMRDFSKRENVKVELVGNNLINIGNILYLKRESKSYDDTQAVKNHLRFLYAGQKPYFEQLSEKTAYIRIPTFDLQYKKQIDSVVAANSNAIEKTPNLIIDVRYNGGGADICYEKLIPFLYTDPIRTVGVQHLSTPLNNKMMLSLSQNENFDREHQQAYKEAYGLLNKNIGKFVSLSDEIVKEKKLDKILPYPENVAVIINNGNASTTEQFLLAAKQSKKTKLFGTTTSGALDISNMNDAPSPDGNFELSYCRSKSYRIPGMTIDGKGIQPDYYMDGSIPDMNWIAHAQKIVEE